MKHSIRFRGRTLLVLAGAAVAIAAPPSAHAQGRAELPDVLSDGLPEISRGGLPELGHGGLPALHDGGLPDVLAAGLPEVSSAGLPATRSKAGLRYSIRPAGTS